MITDTQKEVREEVLQFMKDLPCTYSYIANNAGLAHVTLKKLIDNEKILGVKSLRLIRDFIRKHKLSHERSTY